MIRIVRNWREACAVLEAVEENSSGHCLSVERHTDGSAYVQHVRLGVRLFVMEY